MTHSRAMRTALVAVLAGGCFSSATPATPTLPATRDLGAPWGTPTPYHLIRVDPAGTWAVVCQARADTDHDGTILTYWEMHGDTGGDEMSAYVVDSTGHETPIDDLLAGDPRGRWLAVTIAKAPVL